MRRLSAPQPAGRAAAHRLLPPVRRPARPDDRCPLPPLRHQHGCLLPRTACLHLHRVCLCGLCRSASRSNDQLTTSALPAAALSAIFSTIRLWPPAGNADPGCLWKAAAPAALFNLQRRRCGPPQGGRCCGCTRGCGGCRRRRSSAWRSACCGAWGWRPMPTSAQPAGLVLFSAANLMKTCVSPSTGDDVWSRRAPCEAAGDEGGGVVFTSHFCADGISSTISQSSCPSAPTLAAR